MGKRVVGILKFATFQRGLEKAPNGRNVVIEIREVYNAMKKDVSLTKPLRGKIRDKPFNMMIV